MNDIRGEISKGLRVVLAVDEHLAVEQPSQRLRPSPPQLAALLVACAAGLVLLMFAFAPTTDAQSDRQLTALPGAEVDFADDVVGLEIDPLTGLLHTTDIGGDLMHIRDIAGDSTIARSSYGVRGIPRNGQPRLELIEPVDLAFADEWILVVYRESNLVVRYNRTTLDYQWYRELGGSPTGIDVHGDTAYISFENEAMIQTFPVDFNPITPPINTYSTNLGACNLEPRGIVTNDQWIYFTNDNTGCGDGAGIYRLSRTTGAFDSSFEIEGFHLSIDLGADGLIFSGERDSRISLPNGRISVSSPVTQRVEATVSLPTDGGFGIAVHPSGATAWTTGEAGAQPQFLAATLETCGTQPPTGIAPDGTGLTLFSSANDGLPADSGNPGVTCAVGPCMSAGLATVAQPTNLNQAECDALVDLFEATNGSGWTADDGWAAINSSGPTNPCTWRFVGCTNGRISGIGLGGNNLVGTIPDSLAALTELEVLNLSRNQLTGPVPAGLSDLTRLRVVELYRNQLDGNFPTVAALTGLTLLEIFDNEFTGPLPTGIANLTELSRLRAQGNNFTGTIPSLTSLTKLTEIRLNDNQLTGPIPALNHLRDLTLVRIDKNQLTGPIPALNQLGKLTTLRLEQNNLSGPIPDISGLTQLEVLSLSENSLTGAVPQLVGFTKLTELRLSGNALTGPIPSFSTLSQLEFLRLSRNQLTGPIPGALGQRTTLSYLGVADNNLSGVVPASLQNLTALDDLYLYRSGCLTFETQATFDFYRSVPRNDGLAADQSCAPLDDQFTFTPPDPVLIDVLANDELGFAQLESFRIVTQPTEAVATIEGSQIRYTPIIADTIDDVIVYEVCSPNACFEATVLVTIRRPVCFQRGNSPVLATIWGTSNDDVITGTLSSDVIVGFGGDDTITTGGNADIVCGNEGNDTITTGDGPDIARGGPGNDVIMGEAGSDSLFGGTGEDRLDGGDGNDYLGGFGGADVILGGAGNDQIFGGFGADDINGGAGNDTISGLIGNDIISGGSGDDKLSGDRGRDTIRGGTGRDQIFGGNGDDRLFGDSGDDKLNGGRADDQLSGGNGSDSCSGNRENVADTADASCELIFGVP
jgi:Leucine-rich repeat (LRR) protein